MSYNKLPADPTALILGITGLVIVLPGCCCGLFAIISLGLGIAGLILAQKSISMYTAEPEAYHHKSWSNVKMAKIICIIGIVISALFILAQATLFAVSGEKFSREFWEKFSKDGQFESEKYEKDSTNTWNDQVNIKLKKDGDSIYIDTIATDSTTIKVKE